MSYVPLTLGNLREVTELMDRKCDAAGLSRLGDQLRLTKKIFDVAKKRRREALAGNIR